jgi:hypothetical protein
MKTVHFRIEELVDKDTFLEKGEEAWGLFVPDALTMLDGIREFFDRPVTVNNWLWGGPMQFRGWRPPWCPWGAKDSYHKRGMAFDFNVKMLTAEEVRQILVENKDDPKFRLIQRLEADVRWVHADIGRLPDGKQRIYLFRAS